jgi:hypothetical protein
MIEDRDDRIRAAIDSALRRHVARKTGAAAPVGVGRLAAPDHPSHIRFVLRRETPEGDDALPCLVEPDVRCSHCGYCVSFGH